MTTASQTAPSVLHGRLVSTDLELTGPRPGQCWDLTSVVVRYHIGIKHYVGTYPQADIISCGAGGKPPN
jgi:hypothetical protein